MEHNNFCKDHKSMITWPKFVLTLTTVVGTAVVAAIAVNSHMFAVIDKAEARGIERANVIEQTNVNRNKDTAIVLKEYMEKYIIPTREDVAVIKDQIIRMRKNER